jgi:hypothetical protein
MSREYLRRAFLAGVLHSIPELHGRFGSVAALCHHQETDVIGFGLRRLVPVEMHVVNGYTSCVLLAGHERNASRRSLLRPREKSKLKSRPIPINIRGD